MELHEIGTESLLRELGRRTEIFVLMRAIKDPDSIISISTWKDPEALDDEIESYFLDEGEAVSPSDYM